MGFLLHVGATVICTHAGQATPTAPFPRVTVGGQAIVTQPAPWTVAGCAMPPPPAGNGPCVTAQFVTAALRVTAGGMPALLHESQSVCVPTGTPLQVLATQVHAQGT